MFLILLPSPTPSCLRHIDSIEINCADVADERVPVLKDQLQKWFDEAAWHAPSILFFDDIDRLIPAEVEVSQRARDVLKMYGKKSDSLLILFITCFC